MDTSETVRQLREIAALWAADSARYRAQWLSEDGSHTREWRSARHGMASVADRDARRLAALADELEAAGEVQAREDELTGGGLPAGADYPRHAAPALASEAREATASPYIGKRERE
jgi:hypothetical protein